VFPGGKQIDKVKITTSASRIEGQMKGKLKTSVVTFFYSKDSLF